MMTIDRSPERAGGGAAVEANNKDEYLRECLEIGLEDLNESFCKVPGDIAFWNARYADATTAHQTAKLDYEQARAKQFVKLKNEADPATGKPRSLDLCGVLCDAHEGLYELSLDTIQKDAERIRMRGIVDAISAKRDMLQSLGAKLRVEMRGAPTSSMSEEDRKLGNW
jgi:hypothetical protein